jgi:serine protease Do
MDLLAGYRHQGRLRTITPSAATVVLPAAPAVRIADELVRHGFVERGYLGVQVELVDSPTTASESRRGGVLVHQLVVGGPAERAGLLPGDFILEFGGVDVRNADDLAFSVASRRPGTSARVRFLRRGIPLRVTVLLEQAPTLPWESRFDEALAGRLPAAPTR